MATGASLAAVHRANEQVAPHGDAVAFTTCLPGEIARSALTALDLVSSTTQVLIVLLATASNVTAVRRPRLATIEAALFFGVFAVRVGFDVCSDYERRCKRPCAE